MLQVNKFAFAPIIYAEEIFVLNHRRNEGFYLHRLLSNTFEEHQKLGFLAETIEYPSHTLLN